MTSSEPPEDRFLMTQLKYVNNDRFSVWLSINVPVNNFPVMLGRSHCFLGFYQYLGELGDIGDYNSLAEVILIDTQKHTI